jgi:hypothetical protein
MNRSNLRLVAAGLWIVFVSGGEHPVRKSFNVQATLRCIGRAEASVTGRATIAILGEVSNS